MDQMDHLGSRTGNTGTVRARLSSYWNFTFNNYMDHMDHLISVLNHECTWYVFQEEKGENGTPHLQGTLKFINRKRLTQCKQLLGKELHWEITRCVNASIAYCSKEETRAGKQWTKGIDIPKPIKLITEFKPWQQDIINILNEEPNDRTIHWFWDNNGNIGKTALTKYICVNMNAIVLSGKQNDMFNGVLQYHKSTGKWPNVVIFDIPRSALDYVSYGGMEKIKDGMFFSGKYEGGMCVFNSPHVLCFANAKPDTSIMSQDRWSIIQL